VSACWLPRALACAQVLHRDVALKNVFLAEDGSVKLGDFGVARILDSTQELALTKVGTPCYIAPERCEGRPYSYEADVWSMGCLLYELLTTRPAFAAETIPQVTAKILSAAYSGFDEADASVPPPARGLIASILAVQADERPTLPMLLDGEPGFEFLRSYVQRHASVREQCAPGTRRIASVEIPLIGYEGASKTKFSERPVFVDGGGRIVDEQKLSAHDEKLLGARQRRQRQLAERRGNSSGPPSAVNSEGSTACASGSGPAASSNPNFEKVTDFGAGGVVGFLVQSGAAGGTGGSGAAPIS